jgi:hypothetical protein
MSDIQQTASLPNTLSRRQLTIGLILLTLIPFSFVVLMYLTLPTSKDPLLEVQVEIGPRTWVSNDGTQTRLLPSLILRNPTGDLWRNVNLSLNEQFYYYHPDPVQAGEELVIPLKFFHTKGNQFYPPESQPLKKLMIFAQVPSGARAIREMEIEQQEPFDSSTPPPPLSAEQ